jgi:hypothetical protein
MSGGGVDYWERGAKVLVHPPVTWDGLRNTTRAVAEHIQHGVA